MVLGMLIEGRINRERPLRPGYKIPEDVQKNTNFSKTVVIFERPTFEL